MFYLLMLVYMVGMFVGGTCGVHTCAGKRKTLGVSSQALST